MDKPDPKFLPEVNGGTAALAPFWEVSHTHCFQVYRKALNPFLPLKKGIINNYQYNLSKQCPNFLVGIWNILKQGQYYLSKWAQSKDNSKIMLKKKKQFVFTSSFNLIHLGKRPKIKR